MIMDVQLKLELDAYLENASEVLLPVEMEMDVMIQNIL